MRTFLLTVHIFAAAAWIGGGMYAAASFGRHAENSGFKKAYAVDQWLGARFFGTALGVLILSGIALVITSDVIGWGAAFVWLGIGVVLVTSVLEGAVFGPVLKRQAEAEEEIAASPGGLLQWGTLATVALMAFAVWAMVAKPGL